MADGLAHPHVLFGRGQVVEQRFHHCDGRRGFGDQVGDALGPLGVFREDGVDPLGRMLDRFAVTSEKSVEACLSQRRQRVVVRRENARPLVAGFRGGLEERIGRDVREDVVADECPALTLVVEREQYLAGGVADEVVDRERVSVDGHGVAGRDCVVDFDAGGVVDEHLWEVGHRFGGRVGHATADEKVVEEVPFVVEASGEILEDRRGCPARDDRRAGLPEATGQAEVVGMWVGHEHLLDVRRGEFVLGEGAFERLPGFLAVGAGVDDGPAGDVGVDGADLERRRDRNAVEHATGYPMRA